MSIPYTYEYVEKETQPTAFNENAINKEKHIVQQWEHGKITYEYMEEPKKRTGEVVFGKFPISKKWQSSCSRLFINQPPKTDVRLNCVNFSVKYSNDFQWVSSGMYDQRAILRSIRPMLKNSTYFRANKLIDMYMQDYFDLPEYGNITHHKKIEHPLIMDMIEGHKKITKEYNHLFTKEELYFFLRECLTGEHKFEDTPRAIPEAVALWDKKKKKVEFHKITEDYIYSYLDRIRWDFSFKSSFVKSNNKQYKAFTVLRLHSK